MANYKLSYPEKYQAKLAAQRIPKKIGFNNHHWSYNIEHLKDVISLSAKNHSAIHSKMVYDNDTKYFRIKKNGFLLDTKQKHLDFIQSVLIENASVIIAKLENGIIIIENAA